ncbi:MAG: 50S ribosomal protein L2 [Thermoprotei archaeon]|nr:MAG: 50S ribosomal protein L2 [Thermoprotei archaeon]RLF23646.1 MAG: 50S ribosomal protein L2 [Thermoprotei archaeon]
MGKRILVQRMGRGSPTFISPSWRREGPARYPLLTKEQLMGLIRGRVVEIFHDSGCNTPRARIALENGVEFIMIAPEGLIVGQTIEIGAKASIMPGNILPIGAIPEGTMVCNVELRPGDGGKIARSSGTYVTVLTHTNGRTIIQLPSRKTKAIPNECLATIGICAGGGRIDKPMLKAGKAYHKWKARARKWPRVRGKAMGAYAHPHGGGSHPKGAPPVSRHAPPGAKVGHIASRRTGRRKG